LPRKAETLRGFCLQPVALASVIIPRSPSGVQPRRRLALDAHHPRREHTRRV